MSKKVSDLAKARKDKREKAGWSLEEIKKMQINSHKNQGNTN